MHWSHQHCSRPFLCRPGRSRRAARRVNLWSTWSGNSTVNGTNLQQCCRVFLSLIKYRLSVSIFLCLHTSIAPTSGLENSVDILKHKKVNYCFWLILFESFCNIMSLFKRRTVWVSSYILSTCNLLNKWPMNKKTKQLPRCVKPPIFIASPRERQNNMTCIVQRLTAVRFRIPHHCFINRIHEDKDRKCLFYWLWH